MSFTSAKAVTTSRTGASLVATFHRANPPLIWRFDLERNHSFTLALQGEESDWELGVTSPKGEFYPIAHFALREDAEEAFNAVSKSLARGPGRWLALKILLLIAIVAVCAFVVFGFLVGRDMVLMNSQLLPVTHAVDGEVKSGVPQAADDVLRPPPQ